MPQPITIPKSAKTVRLIQGWGSKPDLAKAKIAGNLISRGFDVKVGRPEADIVIDRSIRRVNVYLSHEGDTLNASYRIVTRRWFKVLVLLLTFSVVGMISLPFLAADWYRNGRPVRKALVEASNVGTNPREFEK